MSLLLARRQKDLTVLCHKLHDVLACLLLGIRIPGLSSGPSLAPACSLCYMCCLDTSPTSLQRSQSTGPLFLRRRPARRMWTLSSRQSFHVNTGSEASTSSRCQAVCTTATVRRRKGHSRHPAWLNNYSISFRTYISAAGWARSAVVCQASKAAAASGEYCCLVDYPNRYFPQCPHA